MQLKVHEDPNNPDFIVIGGNSTRDIKNFIKKNYANPVYEVNDKEWIINKKDQPYEVDTKRIYAQLRAKVIERQTQRDFGKKYHENPNEETQLNYGKSILVFKEYLHMEHALSRLKDLQSKPKAEITVAEAANLSYLDSALTAAKYLEQNGLMKKDDSSQIVHFEKWQDRVQVASELTTVKREDMFKQTEEENTRVYSHERI